ncbi:uncharacterized protein EI90DRAFT_267264 [Cantharellus anzutake]|uniref:uncharacterized protein n=1 Tax=Cantharellus anzutake TaxID=1750568 RepID=UPI00190786DF|nr:uncharacterized protein EI90DRAFT_267264 [Cantharellus anzutake]KAF8335855.1 hypothetical protein EI90DRAFT_267264 [Cantharellus anzutake]
MDVILRILDTSTLPSNTPRKTYGLALAILQVQRLPERILGPFVGRISSAIRRGLDGEYGREGKKGPAWESLGALQTLADGEIIAFHEHFPQLFNSLLSYLVSPCSTSLRLKAAIALGALGHYSLLHRIEGLVVPVMRASAALSPVLTTAFQKGGLEGAWAVTVLAAIVALTGYQFHLSRKWMKTFMHCSQTGLNAKKDVGMKFASRALWCFLLWAWEDGHAQGIEGFQANDDTGLMIRQAKRTQEGNIAPVVQAPLLQRPMGASLVAAFIGDGSDQEAVATGISVLHEMFVNHSPLNIELLFRLLAFFVKTGDERIDLKIGESDVPWKYSKLVCTPILNGSLIANADMNSFIQSAKDMLSDDANGSIRLADVRPLDGEEVTTHWDKLMRCWDTMFKQGLALSDSSIQSTCHKLWVALVKARVSAASTLVERKALSRSMVDRIASFLEKSPSEWAPESALSIGASQCSISAASAMFSALVHEADSEKSFPSFPMDLLDRVVQTNVSLSTPEIRTLWRDFIVGIVRVGSEDSAFFEFLRNRVLAENCARRAPPQSGAVQKAVWGSVWDCAVFLVTQTPLAELSVKWEDIVLLTQCIPFSDADPNVEWSIIEARWNTIIQAAVERCDLINVSRACLIEKAVSCISHQRIGLRGSMKALSLLFSLLENNEKRTLDACKDEDRTQGLYDLFNKLAGGDALTTASLVPEGSRHLEAVLDCISVIERVVRTTPPKFVVSRLCNLQPGLLPWLRDEHAVLTELQYNTVVSQFGALGRAVTYLTNDTDCQLLLHIFGGATRC